MTARNRLSHPIHLPYLLIPLVVVLTVVAPAFAEAAVARVSVSAELVDPAVIDAAKLLSAAGAPASQPEQKPVSQAQPHVQLTVVGGVSFLNIDYN
jgi:hypothetical protein